MRDKILADLIDSLCKKIEDKEIKLDASDFHKIEKNKSYNRLVFIDGGQAEILKAVNFSLQLIRTCAVVIKDNKRTDIKINEFFVLINSVNEGNKIYYETEIFPVKGKVINKIRLYSSDPTIKNGIERAEISIVGNIVRRFAELEIAKDMIDELSNEDMIILDGSLKTLVTNENEMMNKLFEKALSKDVIISSLAKTSKIFTDNASCLLSQLSQIGYEIDHPWYYNITQEKDYFVVSVCLNKNDGNIFEFNILNKQKEKLESVLGLLIENSRDVIFPGYPYGLILADKFARISNREKEHLLMILKTKAGKDWIKIKKAIDILNSHEKLDNIS